MLLSKNGETNWLKATGYHSPENHRDWTVQRSFCDVFRTILEFSQDIIRTWVTLKNVGLKRSQFFSLKWPSYIVFTPNGPSFKLNWDNNVTKRMTKFPEDWSINAHSAFLSTKTYMTMWFSGQIKVPLIGHCSKWYLPVLFRCLPCLQTCAHTLSRSGGFRWVNTAHCQGTLELFQTWCCPRLPFDEAFAEAR